MLSEAQKIESRRYTQRKYKSANKDLVRAVNRQSLVRNKRFISFDGEGYDDKNGKHIYNIFACNDETLIDNAGLDTLDILSFIMRKKKEYPKAIFVSFYFSYDVNMILKDVPHDVITRLQKEKRAYIFYGSRRGDCYNIEFIPRKWVRIKQGSVTEGRFTSAQAITIYDVYGFFQDSFINAARAMNIASPDELSFISDFKGQRGGFDTSQTEAITRYNTLECELLSRMMLKLFHAFEAVDIRLSSWHGAGAAAGAVLKKHRIGEHITHYPELDTAVRSAYFGGRIQNIRLGEFDKTFGHDIISAYPSAMQYLPSLTGATWVKGYSPDGISLAHIRWKGEQQLLNPFPFRLPDGRITYPPNGEGWYWYHEIEAAKSWKGKVKILQTYTLNHNDVYPFDFIPAIFTQREQLKREGNYNQIALKLALNSLYGKVAQKPYREQEPPYLSYIWAGLITSDIRARMFSLANPDTVIGFATDGLYSTEKLAHDAPGLGGWEVAEYDSAFFLKAGFYELTQGAKTIRRTRGVPVRSFDFSEAREVFRRDGVFGKISCNLTRFCGMGLDHYDTTWRTWQDFVMTVNLLPAKGIAVPNGNIYDVYSDKSTGVSMPYLYDKSEGIDDDNPRPTPPIEVIQ